jgi:sigma-B regulation protein RsbU (phosphoserine phosphatase)
MRRRMPWVAVAAALLLLLRDLAGDTVLFGDHLPGTILGIVTFLATAAAIIYYVPKGLAWLGRRLLWRVRRRLVITYLFVGLTPIVLMGLLGLIAAFGISAEGMARLVTVQVDSVIHRSLLGARATAAGLAALPGSPGRRGADGGGPEARAWIEARAAALQESLPGARVRLDPALPEWLHDRTEWSGLTHGPFAVRAVARGSAGGRPFVLLLEVPFGPALVDRLREASGIALAPAGDEWEAAPVSEGADGEAADEKPEVEERLGGSPYMVILPSTDWRTGESGERVAFVLPWSWAEASRQLLGSGLAGQVWRQGLLAIGVVFLGLELLALFAAIWITRAVTGTVHDLHRATEFIDRGDFSHRVRVRSRDQLGELAEAFNGMSAHIESLLRERVERERLQRELEIAAQVQAQLFPRVVPRLLTAELAGGCRAAAGVAGDYFDYLEIEPGLVALALGDVAGKGISAALLMSNMQASLRAQATILAERGALRGAADGAVARMTASINEQMCRSADANRFATLFLALYEDRTRLLRYTNAGHNPPILMQSDGAVDRLVAGGTLVGAFADARYTQAETEIRPGALLIVFSDGISEARNDAGQEYGEERLIQFARKRPDLAADSLRQAIFDEIDSWSGAQERYDDQTLVIARARPAPA